MVTVERDGNYSESEFEEHYGYCQTDFYFGCEHGDDVIEEDALNAKSCIEVLRILIANEDKEIEQLEKDLSSLQTELQLELVFAMHEKPEACFSCLRERIYWLQLSIKTLKNDHAHDIHTKPLLHNNTLHQLVKDLPRNHCQDAYAQQENAVVEDVSATGNSDLVEFECDFALETAGSVCQKVSTLADLCQTNSIHNMGSKRINDEQPQAHALISEISANLSNTSSNIGGNVEVNNVLHGSKICEIQRKAEVDVEVKNVGHDSKISEVQRKTEVDIVVNLVDSVDVTSPLLPDMLKELRKDQLRTIAKQHNFGRYSRLRKEDLIEFLVHRLRSR